MRCRASSYGRGDAVRVEYALDVAQARDALLQLLGVADLDDEAVFHHRVLGHATRAEDVDPGLREGAREILQQAGAVVGANLQLGPRGGLVLALPGALDEPSRRLHQPLHVLAVGAVDGDAAPERDVAGDRVTRHRPAALGEAHGDVVGALDPDPVVGGVLGPPRLVLTRP